MLIVVALGGNALRRHGESISAETQRLNVRAAAASLAELIGAGHRLVVTHGNGPQVGLLALQAAAQKPDEAYPLDTLGAETEGMIGYLIEQELENALPDGPKVATLLTQVEVDPNDLAFRNPTKPVGPVYEKDEAERLAAARGWSVAPEGDKSRRVVPSPAPKHIPDVDIIRILLDANVVVICAGGGGISVVRRADGSLVGVQAVIDKDRTANLLAQEIGADVLLLLTDVDAVYLDWGKPSQKAIGRATPTEMRQRDFAAGSMGPKVDAAATFAALTGGIAGIGRLDQALAIFDGSAGTQIDQDVDELIAR
ncbi:carbamate kinase [Devosia psychrophila]|uniref:Carbamate kinase n=1 Tax=Devosia psychrophila TaxID=728005 RepID=A0ABR5DU78_9HYPH|nr:carbamate kinase [Devosia psychrophila]KKC31572.1 carbamate kinase [Devosia psychrophila]